MPTIVQEYLIKGDKTSEYIILALALILIIGFWAIIFFFSIKNPGNVKAFLTCKTGECPTNKFSGEKRCPLNSSLQLEYDPEFEVCNPANSCTAIETPYAVQSDSSTDITGKCDINQCRCVNFLSTPSYIETMFNVTNGSLFSTGSQNQGRVTLQQQASPYVGEGNNVPMIFTDSTTQLWQIAPSLLSYIVPSPCSQIFINSPEATNTDYLNCINSNPCVSGKMSYLAPNAATFAQFSTLDVAGGFGLGCVPNSVENSPNNDNTCFGTWQCVISGSTYDCLYAPVFNPSSGRVRCLQVSVPSTDVP